MGWFNNLFGNPDDNPYVPPRGHANANANAKPKQMNFQGVVEGDIILTRAQVKEIVNEHTKKLKTEINTLHDRITKLQKKCKSLSNEQVKNLISQETNQLKLRIEDLERINDSQMK